MTFIKFRLSPRRMLKMSPRLVEKSDVSRLVYAMFHFGRECFSAHVLCVDTGRSSETAKAHRG
eukprot:TRINITY_DN1232_c0_g1_i1.p1 TRINITY_DN1232_c0_g1~~TRINITY_DN1232_c0_g1_i1.p1  ORF type:complete len:63 (+),score=7.43 TRINITY_DN1232_c0_g1_i1:287-475(+)